MDLQNHTCLETALGELSIDDDHGQLDEVGRRALQGCIDSSALCKSALVGVAALDIRNGPDTPEHRAH